MRRRSLRTLFWCAAIALGSADGWATRFTMNPDGVSYLDMGEACLQGDLHRAINAWWSPMYSCFLGLILKLLRPSPYWEFPVVHLANVLIYIGSLACFEFFLSSYLDARPGPPPAGGEEEGAPLPEWALRALGYSFFIWTSLRMITLRLATPDMCVAAFVYLASGLLVRIRTGTAPRRTLVLLGIVLGFGYLAKAVMFPLAFVFLGVALLSSGPTRVASRRIALPLAIFLLIAAPLVAALSRAKGRPTFGDSGRVDYAVYVDGVDLFIPEGGPVTHPVPRIFERPEVFEFGQPISGTYPLWYDPSYWHEGINPHFNPEGQVAAITHAVKHYGLLFLGVSLQLHVSVGLLLLVLAAPRPGAYLGAALAEWPLLVPALCTFGLYALVVAEYRFLGAFACLLWMAAFSAVRMPGSVGPRRHVAVATVVAMVVTSALSVVSAIAHNFADPQLTTPRHWQAAQALHEQGVEPGDGLAVISELPFGDGGAYVARLARARIIAEVKDPQLFWQSSDPVRTQVMEALARTGAKAVLAWGAPPIPVAQASWKRLGATDYFIHRLDAR